MLNTEGSNIKIAKVDCTTDNDVCNENDVTGYPTLKFFKTGETEGIKFRGTRDLPSLTTFINEQISLVSQLFTLFLKLAKKYASIKNKSRGSH